jgi:hypothetical protein
MKFVKKNEFGRTIYRYENIVATQTNNKLNVTISDEPKYSAGFVNINSVSKFLDEEAIWNTDFYDLGFEQTSDTCWEYHENSLDIVITYDTFNETFEICSNLGKPRPDWIKSGIRSGIDVIRYIFDIFDKCKVDPIKSACICDPNADMQAVTAAISSRNLSSKLQRVKSSNLWSYAFDTSDRDAKFGTMLIQFKGRQGGPGDIYQYFDVPINLWRRFISANSKGHFFWVYVRNNFKYRKLTGDKRGKLPNAVN